jgi:hypothetical protein
MKESKRGAAVPAATPKLKLQKNHGLIINGRANSFYAAGTEFDPVADAHIIFALVKSGALIG